MTESQKRPSKKNLHGILLLDKPLGLSSAQVLNKAKWLLQASKAGHTGTLDPLASGLLPLCFGHATKLAVDLIDSDKSYIATLCLGKTSTTGDAEGQLTAIENAMAISQDQWLGIQHEFMGAIWQVPPMYSALKKDGKPLYTYARQGIEIDREPRKVQILKLETLSFNYPYVQIEVTCSKGTYIRTLVEDLGKRLGQGAYLTELQRVSVGDLHIKDAINISELEEMDIQNRQRSLLPLDTLLQNCTRIEFTLDQAKRFGQGQRIRLGSDQIPQVSTSNDSIRLYCQDELIGLAKLIDQVIHPEKVLLQL